MGRILCKSRRGGIKDYHLILLSVDALHLLLELLFIVKHELTLHDIELSI